MGYERIEPLNSKPATILITERSFTDSLWRHIPFVLRMGFEPMISFDSTLKGWRHRPLVERSIYILWEHQDSNTSYLKPYVRYLRGTAYVPLTLYSHFTTSKNKNKKTQSNTDWVLSNRYIITYYDIDNIRLTELVRSPS